MTSLADNLYQRLGFRTQEDGSVSDKVRQRAIALLGFKDTEEYCWESWSEMVKEKRVVTNIVPSRLSTKNLSISLAPGDSLGYFFAQCSHASSRDGNRSFHVPRSFSPLEASEAIRLVKEEIERIKRSLPESVTEDVYNDPRYSYSKTLGTWLYCSQPVKLLSFSFADGTRLTVSPLDTQKSRFVLAY